MTHQHTSNGREWLMVEVPSGARDFKISSIGNLHYHYNFTPDNFYSFEIINLFDTSLVIHSDSLTITEEQAGEIVERYGARYMDYLEDGYYGSALESYRSLLRSKNINSRVINLVKQ